MNVLSEHIFISDSAKTGFCKVRRDCKRGINKDGGSQYGFYRDSFEKSPHLKTPCKLTPAPNHQAKP